MQRSDESIRLNKNDFPLQCPTVEALGKAIKKVTFYPSSISGVCLAAISFLPDDQIEAMGKRHLLGLTRAEGCTTCHRNCVQGCYPVDDEIEGEPVITALVWVTEP